MATAAGQAEQAQAALTAALGDRLVWRVDEAARYAASMDNLRLSRLPEAVAVPAAGDAEAVSQLLAAANAAGIPVTARGAGSATTGAATPWQGGWVLDLSAWKALRIDAPAMVAYAGPGVTVEALDAAARQHGLFYPPDPGSRRHATLGGTLACNAGGLRGAKYGVTRDYVLGLEGCLADGALVRWGGPLRKYVSGYNLRDLWIGSEGTLGIITGAWLKLLPRPAETRTALVSFRSEAQALDAVAQILDNRLVPSILEFLDAETLAALRGFWADKGAGLREQLPPVAHPLLTTVENTLADAETQALLLIELDGHSAEVEANATGLRSIVERLAVRLIEAEESPATAEALWAVRRTASQAMFRLGPHKLNEDIVLPLARYGDFFMWLQGLRAETGLPMPTFGHAADGNFHVHLMYDRADPAQSRAAQTGVQRLMEQVVALGGVITGEHGIGLAKSPFFLELQHSAAELAAMRAVKQAFDPRGILNPGKWFEPVNVWEAPVERVRLPWDH